MLYKLELEIGVQKTDSNKIDGHHWAVKHTTRKSLKQEIALKTRGKCPVKPLELFTVHITRHCPARNFLDYDNMVTSFKAILDGLKNAGIIKNDSWKYVTRENYFPDQKIDSKMLIKLRVEEVNPNQGRTNGTV